MEGIRKISNDDYQIRKWVSFKDWEIEKIREYCNILYTPSTKNFIRVDLKSNSKEDFTEYITTKKRPEWECDFIEQVEDEWYMYHPWEKGYFYLCDQFDSLILLLENLTIGNSKIFESNQDKDLGYQEITRSQFDTDYYYNYSTNDPYNRKEIDLIESTLLFGEVNIYNDSMVEIKDADGDREVMICKLKDEWYLVEFTWSILVSNSIETVSNEYYKCDQLDGLINCLRDKSRKRKRRFIKKLEEYSWEENLGYQKITMDQFRTTWVQYQDDYKYSINDPYTRREINMIESILEVRVDVYFESNLELIEENNEWDIIINKIRDEWYLIKFTRYIYVDDVKSDSVSEYYKCDQFDGLVNCLKELKGRAFRITKTMIKKFEEYSYGEDLGYKEIQIQDKLLKMKLGIDDNFTKEEINKISEISGIRFGFAPHVFSSTRILSRIDGRVIEVIKYDDEWYLVSYDYEKYYLCDQWDGLINCLKDIKSKLSGPVNWWTEWSPVEEEKKFESKSEDEEIEEDLGYEEIEQTEFVSNEIVSYTQTKNLDRFTDKEIDYFTNNLNNVSIFNRMLGVGTLFGGTYINIELRRGHIHVIKGKDEWYYVHHSRSAIKMPDKYYQCDQWDGLINCLNDLIGLKKFE